MGQGAHGSAKAKGQPKAGYPGSMSVILIALDSVGIDPLGHERPESVYSESAFLFPPGSASPRVVTQGPRPGALVETDVTGGRTLGTIECAITYASIFSGRSALDEHGLMEGLGLRKSVLEGLLTQHNLFREVPSACLANAIFPRELPNFRSSYVADLLPSVEREELEARLRWRGERVRLVGPDKRGVAELFTLVEINQNVFVYAARQAGLELRTWEEVREGRALTSSLTHSLEAEFEFADLDLEPLPERSEEEAAEVLASLAQAHAFVFYKFQLADLVSHTGRVELARGVFAQIERFVGALLERTPADSTVVITSDHGHLEQVGFTQGHPKSLVPTWVFGPDALEAARALTRPEAIFDLVRERAGGP